ncbi:BspA family leucine-rich repeat surface protein, partial [Xylanibacter ruminicola]
MFDGCTSLVGGENTPYDADRIDYTYAHIDGGKTNPGYFSDVAYKGKENEPYAVLSEENTKLTFYYDKKKETRGGMDVGPFSGKTSRGWHGATADITKIVFDSSFANCTSITSTAYWFAAFLTNPTFEGMEYFNTVNVTDMTEMFSGSSSLSSLDLSRLNTSSVKKMSLMFYECNALETLNLTGWNTANVTNMSQMFTECTQLQSIDVSSFNTGSVTDMSSMFASCSSLTSLDVSNFNTSNVTTFNSMFSGCSNLTSLNLSGFDTSNATVFAAMFAQCPNLTSLDLSSFNTRNALTVMNMFYSDTSLKEIFVGADWSLDKISETSDNGNPGSGDDFTYCYALVGGSGTTYSAEHTDYTYSHIDGGTSNPGYLTDVAYKGKENEPYAVLSDNNDDFTTGDVVTPGKTLTFYYDKKKSDRSGLTIEPFYDWSQVTWVTSSSHITKVVFDDSFANYSSLTSTSWWFSSCSNLKEITGLENLKTDNVTNMSYMFNNCSSLTSLDLSKLKTGNVENMYRLFSGCSALSSLNLSDFNTAKVTNMNEMFQGCSSLTTLNLDYFDTSNVTDMSSMFYGCSGLSAINVSRFNTAKVKTMNAMFRSCSGLTSLDISTFNTESVTDMGYMFHACSGLTSIYFGDINTSSVTNLGEMFWECENLTTLDLSKFNTASVTSLERMFADCINLKTIYVGSGWSTDAVEFGYDTFVRCLKLVGDKGTTYNVSNSTHTYARVDGGPNSETPGYLTDINSPSSFGVAISVVGNGKLTIGTTEINVDNPLEITVNRGDSITMIITPTSGNLFDNIKVDDVDVTEQVEIDATSKAMTYTFGGVYGEHSVVATFVNDTNEAYSVLTDNTDDVTTDAGTVAGKTLTFYYDKQKEARGGMDATAYWEWHRSNELITSVVFDDSFANCNTIESTASWFQGCKNLTSITGLDKLNTTNVTEMQQMFYECSSLTSLDLRSFNTANVNTMFAMFYGCSSLASVDVSSFNTESVEYLGNMFYNCSSLTSLDLSNFNTASAKNMGGMFSGCSNLTTIYVSQGWTTDLVVADEGLNMFNGCEKLVGGIGTVYDPNNYTYTYAHIDGGISNPGYLTDIDDITRENEPYAVLTDNTENVTTDAGVVVGKTLTFYYDKHMQARGGMSVGPFSYGSSRDWNTSCSSITTVVFDDSFANCTSLTSTANWFDDCVNLATIQGIENLKTTNVTDMHFMFSDCSSLISLDLSGFDMSNVSSTLFMFQGCRSLQNVIMTNWDTSSLKNMNGMFEDCATLTSVDISGFNTSNVEFMQDVFAGCDNLRTINLTGIITSEVTTMWGLFRHCSNLTTLDLSSFNTSKVTDMSNMFLGCGLEAIYVGNGWSTSAVTVSEGMFSGCSSLVGGAGTKYDSNNVSSTYAHIDGGTSNPGYLTDIVEKDQEVEPYAVLTDNTGGANTRAATVATKTLTFYYDKRKAARNGMSVGPFELPQDRGWESVAQNITAVEFDASMANDTTITSTAYWFYGCQELTSITGMENLRTQSVTDMKYMFYGCNELEQVDVSGFNTAKATDMSGMFYKCHRLQELNLSSFNTFKVSNMSWMFYGCYDITKIYVASYWTTASVTESEEMFVNCTNLVGGAGTIYNESHVDATYAHLDDGVDNPGYFTNFTGVTLTAKDYSREYGDDNPTFEFTAKGVTLSGKPSITCEATKSSPAGTYPITIAYTKVDGESELDITCVNGTLTITKAPLTIAAKSYTIKQGKALPTFEVEYSGFKNNETEAVLTTMPAVSVKANEYSEPGEYEITVSGAEADNYEISYVSGTLTITAKTESFNGTVLTVEDGGSIDDAFESYGGRDEAAKTLAAIVWNSDTPLTSEMLEGIDNPNLLVYVKKASMAPAGVNNVVINGTARSIVLVDTGSGNNNFYVPQEFTAEKISYTREFKQTTKKNVSRGWEGICLPFDV